MRVTVIGAGVAGLVAAVEFARRGAEVELVERGQRIGDGACSWAAGGMIAPWCEHESGEPDVARLGVEALKWWPRQIDGVSQNGTLVVAGRRDTAELARFARDAKNFERVDAAGIAALEPDLADRFAGGLFFAEEAHLDPRRALPALADRLRALGGRISFGVAADPDALDADIVLDCRGFAARDVLEDLRGVRGEMLLLRTAEIALNRPIRMLHPRIPLYVVPRGDGLFMVGATSIESASRAGVTARSAVELINGAYALHPAFGEAEIVEACADVRPAFPDNMPKVQRVGRVIRVNGFHRNGFLLSPAIASEAADAAFGLLETHNETDRQRLSA